MPPKASVALSRIPDWAMPLLDRRSLMSAGVVAAAGLSALMIVHAPFRIGVLNDLSSGQTVDASRGTLLAATMALEDFGGRVLGRPIQILAGDTQGNPAIAIDVATSWFDHEQTSVLLDGSDTATGRSVRALASQRGEVVLGVGDPAALSCQPTIVQFTPSPAEFVAAALAPALDAGVRNWFCITASGDVGAEWQARATTFIAGRGGTVVGALDRQFAAADSAVAEQVRRSGATGIVFATAGAALIEGVRHVHDLGLSQGRTLVGLQVDLPDVAAIGPAAEGLTFATTFHPAMTENALVWTRRFLARHREQPPGWRQALAYSATLHYLRAVKAASAASSAQIVAWMVSQPVRDVLVRTAPVRQDGRVMIDLEVVRVRSGAGSDLLGMVERVGSRPADAVHGVASDRPCAARS